jgi:hypothetical protein
MMKKIHRNCIRSRRFTSSRLQPAVLQQSDRLGVVELSAKTPKHLSLDGKDCTLTATPLADGKLSVVIETQIVADGKNTPRVRPGTPARAPNSKPRIDTDLQTTKHAKDTKLTADGRG